MDNWYQLTIIGLLICGLVPALVFVSQHRPRHWRRLAAWDASGFVIVAALIYTRSLILIISRWPGSPPRGWLDGAFGIVSLIAIDVLFIIRVLSYHQFTLRAAENNPINK